MSTASRDARGRFVRQPPSSGSSVPAVPVAASVAPVAPSGLRSWHCFLFLIAAAALWHFAKGPLIGIGLIVGILAGIGWAQHRFPRTVHTLPFILNAFLGGSRRR